MLSTVSTRRTRAAVALSVAGLALGLSACGGNSGSGSGSSGSSGGSGDKIGVSLITKDSTNPFFVAMQNGAKQEAQKAGNIDLTVASGSKDGDEAGQITAIENSIAKGDKGILITPNGPGVNASIKKARAQGLYVIALDTPPDPADTVDITFATDNFKAGELIGQWAKAQMGGKPAVIALLDLFNDKVVSVDYNRDQGFLSGMGIDTVDKKKNGDEAKTGNYDGGTYTIVCNEPTQGAEDGGRTAMENCLTKNPNINLVYTINEPAATGADAALKAAKKTGYTIVSVDGGCQGVKEVKDGVIGATSQQYPLKMAQLGVEAISKYAKDGTKPSTSPGLDFFDTGVQLVTDKPANGVTSITSDEGSKVCWGSAS
ncbi:substrate-binding domain-containing protein [Lapillicoccus jejuensis]|uniref:Fructose transport system substrate-binding protein n=1 Tax=Lapillicoccus jejuensis TaxID=402171 RepID=A0A542DWY9_9MICO|nr:substrate-binding domain-containing protein [Lapillicoccus jejuensis]TQJ07601.1 fructose transport system substrate-binding protein [Lapillicoccus jejuensis]